MPDPSVNDVRMESWDQLNQRLYEGSWQESLGRFRSSFAFRGMPRAGEGLETGLARLAGNPPENIERHLLRNFRKYARRDSTSGDSIWEWLAVAQHHGLPTRLLDWTFSPSVALHFATDDPAHFEHDAIVWRVNYVKVHELAPPSLKQVLEEEEADVFTAEMLSRAAGALGQFDGLSAEPFVAFFEPPSLDQRIVNQFALFSLMSSAAGRQDQWLSKRPELYDRIIIPAQLKWEIRDKLDQANVTERVLFPGLDGLSRWLRRYYTPRT